MGNNYPIGYIYGKNTVTNKTGLFPLWKVEEIIQVYDFVNL